MIEAAAQTKIPDPHQDAYHKTIFGFWIYLMTDCLLFTTLFASYFVLRHSTFGGPTSHDIFNVRTAFIETMLLLGSSLTSGLGMLAAKKSEKSKVFPWFILAFLLGLSFVVIEVREFSALVREGNSWQRSAFLSAFFSLVGTHGLHVSIGLFWMAVMMVQVGIMGITVPTFRRLVCFNMFWHFLDLVWIFIFTFVYLLGVI